MLKIGKPPAKKDSNHLSKPGSADNKNKTVSATEHNCPSRQPEKTNPPAPARKAGTRSQTAAHPFECPRDFLQNQFVYITLSPRARGLSIGVNLNPDKLCNFDCVYCEVDRCTPGPPKPLDFAIMAEELKSTLEFVTSGNIRNHPKFSGLPANLLTLRHVALSGDGEPTISPQFTEAVETVIHARALGRSPFFKIVLITNATGLDLPPVKESLKLFIESDEIWCKLDAGSQGYMDRVNRSQVPLEKVLANILATGQQRPVIIQSLFPMLEGRPPHPGEIAQFIERLKELQIGGAKIDMVQIYSATRPIAAPGCGHLPLKTLSDIAKTIRTTLGLRAEVF